MHSQAKHAWSTDQGPGRDMLSSWPHFRMPLPCPSPDPAHPAPPGDGGGSAGADAGDFGLDPEALGARKEPAGEQRGQSPSQRPGGQEAQGSRLEPRGLLSQHQPPAMNEAIRDHPAPVDLPHEQLLVTAKCEPRWTRSKRRGFHCSGFRSSDGVPSPCLAFLPVPTGLGTNHSEASIQPPSWLRRQTLGSSWPGLPPPPFQMLLPDASKQLSPQFTLCRFSHPCPSLTKSTSRKAGRQADRETLSEPLLHRLICACDKIYETVF
ncbi:uncharacterized protein LOC116657505 isoform X2 [Camelus ferus]|uniref:Uncharacterized protein LOC116657505 isoform X2 n=1 Tax=Camelus ferus TaxID=419612 RepID=A0A8B8REY1_CAMFR|nr:uncharacterized protein LOC116657505 isoform X2 [Camelus ferus]